MLERVVHAGHLRKFDSATQVTREPELFEVSDVAYVPDDRAHERVVLPVKVLVRESGYEEESPLAGFREEVANQLLRRQCLERRCLHWRRGWIEQGISIVQ